MHLGIPLSIAQSTLLPLSCSQRNANKQKIKRRAAVAYTKCRKTRGTVVHQLVITSSLLSTSTSRRRISLVVALDQVSRRFLSPSNDTSVHACLPLFPPPLDRSKSFPPGDPPKPPPNPPKLLKSKKSGTFLLAPAPFPKFVVFMLAFLVPLPAWR